MDQMDGQNDSDDTFLRKVRRPPLDISDLNRFPSARRWQYQIFRVPACCVPTDDSWGGLIHRTLWGQTDFDFAEDPGWIFYPTDVKYFIWCEDRLRRAQERAAGDPKRRIISNGKQYDASMNKGCRASP
ncbi:hypothetical protein V8E54_014673 [Elaphomyces granulatus]